MHQIAIQSNAVSSQLLRRAVCIVAALLSAGLTSALATPPNRVPSQVNDTQRVYLTGHVHPKAQPQYDQGQVAPSLELTHMTLDFKLSPAQQADLDQLLANQQNPSSPQYHQWLTPEQYGARFGLSDADLAAATSWLQSQGFTVTGAARGRNYVTFDGTAATVKGAFRTELHNYLVNGETHFANATEPSIPAALEPVVRDIQGLHDFRPKPRAKPLAIQPNYTSTRSANHYIAPDDFATIYDVKPLYDAGIDGTGQKLVIVGQTAINLSDLEQFRSSYNLPGQDPQLVLVANTRSPGISKSDLGEADLDLEWSSAVARNATIIYVYSPDVEQSWQYAIDQNLAPVLSSSYGSCEQSNNSAYATSLRALAQQANTQGMTWFAASGDSGGDDCYGQTSSSVASVDMPASVPEVTGLGGTEFNEGTGTYWNTTNDANQASALSYIPEMVWNDSIADGTPSAGGGGASVYYGKPLWQTGPGVPSDGARDVPDVSLSASADHDGYLVYTAGSSGNVYGGTSVAAPLFAGIATLLNQYLVQKGAQATAGLGNINPTLYALAQSAPSAFHDITAGNNVVTATCRGRGCTATPLGFNAGVGYDQASGLGSVDVFNLLSAWTSAGSGRLIPNMAVSASSTTLSSSDTTVLTATVTGSNGTTPTGSVTFQLGATTLGNAPLSGSGGTATATLNVPASQLTAGANSITAQYNSDNSTFSDAAASVTVTLTTGAVGLTITGIANGASFTHVYAPGEVLSIFGSQLAPSVQTASSVPLPNSMAEVTVTIAGITAPLYMVSPGQLNVQIPYGTPVDSQSTLVVQSSGQTASTALTVGATAPAIFTNQSGAPVPNASGNIGNTITLFITGAGAVSPAVATGAAPASGTPVASLPKPVSAVSVTVGGKNAPIQFEGIPIGLVGVMQINYQVPAGVAAGVQPVVVTVGGASSTDAFLTVLQ